MMKMLKDNLGVKIAALLVAIIAWYYVMEDKNPITEKEIRNVPVQILNVEDLSTERLTLMEPKNPTVTVTLEGKRNDLNQIQSEDIHPTIDLANYLEEGTHILKVRVDKPGSVNLVGVDQPEITVKLENIIKKSMPVSIRIMDQLPDNFVLGETSSTPANIVIEGPSSVVARVESVEAQIFVSNLRKSSTQNVEFHLLDSSGKSVEGLRVKQEFISATVEVNQVKTVPVFMVTEGDLPENVTILNMNISPKEVAVIGNKEVLDNVEEIETSPVNLSTITDDTRVKLTLLLGDGVELYNKKMTVYANFTVDKEIEKTILIPPSSTEVKNLARGLRVVFQEDDFIRVKVKGKKSVIDNWNSKNISLFVDLEGLGRGEHAVSLEAEPLNEVEIMEIIPTATRLKIE